MTLYRFELRQDTAANWTAVNPVLLSGEPGFETDTGKHKIGDGVTAWAGLSYFIDEAALSATFSPLPSPDSLGAKIPAGLWTPGAPSFNQKSSHLRLARAGYAKAAAAQGDVVLAWIGDSNVRGKGPGLALGDVRGHTAPARLREKIAARGVTVSDGAAFPGAAEAAYGGASYDDSRWSFTGASVGVVNGLLLSLDSSSGFTFTPEKNCSRFTITYLDPAWATSFTVSIDGGAATTVNGAVANAFARWESALLSAGPHTITVTGNPTAYIASVEARNDGQGVRLATAGVDGSQASEWASTAANNFLDNVLFLNPVGVVIQLGSNDKNAGRTAAQYAADMTTIINRSTAAGAEVLVVGPSAAYGIDFTDYYGELYDLALSLDFTLIDLRDRIGAYTAAQTAGMFITTAGDTIHLSAPGLDDVAAAVAGVLLPAA